MAEYYTKPESDLRFAAKDHNHNIEELGGTGLQAAMVLTPENLMEYYGNAFALDEVLTNIKNKFQNIPALPTLGNAAEKNVGTGVNDVAAGNHTHPNATPTSPGWMSAADKEKLNGIPEGGGGIPDIINSFLHIAAENGIEFDTGGNCKSRLFTIPNVHDWCAWTMNAQYTPAGWVLDDATKTGWFLKLDGRSQIGYNEFAVYKIPTGEGPHVDEYCVFKINAADDTLRVKDGVAVALEGHTHDYAPTNHEHTGYAAENHTHTGYATESHTHSEYALNNHAHNGYAEASAVNSHISGINHIPHLGTTTNAGDAYTVTTAEQVGDNQKFTVKFNAPSTGAPTLSVNGGTPIAIKKPNGGNAKLYASTYLLFKEGANFTLLGEGGEYGNATPEQVLSPNTIGTENGIVQGTMPNRDVLNIFPSPFPQSFPNGYYSQINIGACKRFATGKVYAGGSDNSGITVTGLGFRPSWVIAKRIDFAYKGNQHVYVLGRTTTLNGNGGSGDIAMSTDSAGYSSEDGTLLDDGFKFSRSMYDHVVWIAFE